MYKYLIKYMYLMITVHTSIVYVGPRFDTMRKHATRPVPILIIVQQPAPTARKLYVNSARLGREKKSPNPAQFRKAKQPLIFGRREFLPRPLRGVDERTSARRGCGGRCRCLD